jgi:tyrosyl-tRNA synthetase
MTNFIEELRWRGLIHDTTPGVEEHLSKGMARAYIGFDPTAPSLTIGNYVQIMLLTFFQRAGHQPVVLMGGATGRIGDPSGKDKERELKTADELDKNIAHQKKQLEKLMDFSPSVSNHTLLVNNFDFYSKMNVLDFLRDVGKNLTINYMMSKDSVKNRLEAGLSFTEFSYQLLQGFDFVVLRRDLGVTMQMGGSDQYGNITAGLELNRKMDEAKVYAVTTPLLTKADGSKFGKSEKGNIWLDPEMTSPYQFYQFWINCDDRDLPKFLRYFSLKNKSEIEAIELESAQTQKKVLAEELTRRIHGDAEFAAVLSVSQMLFDAKATRESLLAMDLKTLQTVAEELERKSIDAAVLQQGIQIIELLSDKTGIFTSKSEAKKAMQNNAISINKEKITDVNMIVNASHLLHNQYVMVENGKKNKYLVLVKE